MNRVFSFIVVAAASSALIQAQDGAPGDARAGRAAGAQPATVTLVGCVRPGTAAVGTSGTATTPAAGQFVLSDVGAPSPDASGTDEAPASSVNERDQRTGGGAAAASGTLPRQIVLEGAAVAPHLNQRVEVTGTYAKEASAATSGDARTGRNGADAARNQGEPGASPAPAQRLQVTAVRRIVGTCGPQ